MEGRLAVVLGGVMWEESCRRSHVGGVIRGVMWEGSCGRSHKRGREIVRYATITFSPTRIRLGLQSSSV